MGTYQVRSMTGLGMGEAGDEGTRCAVEIRSVNNRFLEISVRLPQPVAHREQEIRERVRTRIGRGKIYVSVAVTGTDGEWARLRVVPEKVRLIRELLIELKQQTGVEESLTLDHFLKFSEIFEPAGEGPSEDRVWPHIERALDQALEAFEAMRLQEGSSLAADLAARIQRLDEKVEAVERLATENVRIKHQKLLERVRSLLGEFPLQEERLYTEIALLADRLDVTEECVRLRSHDRLFLETLASGSPVGKKLTFLLQEMNREVNTLSAKASSVEISHLVVEMKEEIEQLREQVQNLE